MPQKFPFSERVEKIIKLDKNWFSLAIRELVVSYIFGACPFLPSLFVWVSTRNSVDIFAAKSCVIPQSVRMVGKIVLIFLDVQIFFSKLPAWFLLSKFRSTFFYCKKVSDKKSAFFFFALDCTWAENAKKGNKWWKFSILNFTIKLPAGFLSPRSHSTTVHFLVIWNFHFCALHWRIW